MSGTLPTVTFTASGPQPTLPATLNAQLIALATSLAPAGLTVLPSGLIEDLASTATGALVVINQAQVDLINSVSPNAANPYILNLLGQMYGVQQGVGSNTGVYVVFTSPTPGYVIPQGFLVSDGTYQYSVQAAGVIGTSGQSQPISAIATQSGTWAVPANTVTQIATSVPSTITLSVSNPLAGSPGQSAQSTEDYRSQVFQAGQATAQGMPSLLRTLLGNVTGVNQNLIAIQQQSTGGWKVIVGGTGDPPQIGFAIFQALFDISMLVGSVLQITNITNAGQAVITTNLNHGYLTGQLVGIAGATGITALNGNAYPVTVLSPTTFSVPVNTSALGTYTGNGVATPNYRNETTTIVVDTDTYRIPYVIPPSQSVTMVVTWNTTATGVVSPATVAAAAQPALAVYINTLSVGQPVNLLELQVTFQTAVASLIPPQLLTRLIFAVSINGIGVSPATGTFVIQGDPESYFVTTTAAIEVNQG